MCELLMD